MSKTVQEQLHGDHQRWRGDHEGWWGDIDEWKKQIRSALRDLRDVEDMLRDSLDALDGHADAIWTSEQYMRAHEVGLYEEVRAGESATDPRWKHTHHEEAARHERLRDAHERIKKHHHAVSAEVVRLVREARKAM